MIKNRTKGLVSVIIPCYNGEKFIAQAIESVLDQTYKDIELIVVNDASTDGSVKIISEFERRAMERFRNFIVILSPKNEGLPKTRNKAIEVSTGEFIAFLDCDDIYSKEKIEIQVELMNGNQRTLNSIKQIGAIYTSYMINDLTKNKISYYQHPKEPALLQDNHICVSSTMVRASVLEKIGLFDPDTGGSCDWDLWVRIESEGYDLRFIDRTLLEYRVHNENASLGRKNRARYELEKKLIILRKAYIQRDKPFNIKMRIWRTRIELLFTYIPFISHPKVLFIFRGIYRFINTIERKVFR